MVLLRGRDNFRFHEFFVCSSQYASTRHGAQQGKAALRSSDMRQETALTSEVALGYSIIGSRYDPPVHPGYPY
ncbi:hypothetical protein TNCV_757321 [Trichonephila clavipes]|nr:hypothetical protein TNCV_757321 [Trichonephila clavipes]